MGIQFELGRMERLKDDLEQLIITKKILVTSYKMKEGKQKDGYYCSTEHWQDYEVDTPWTTLDSHRWLRTSITIPAELHEKHVEFCISTGREGEWDATNPQMLFYLNGKLIQGVDVNHSEITISQCACGGDCYEIAILAYSGTVKGDLIIHTEIIAIDDLVQQLYYDILVPLESAKILKKGDEENYRRVVLMLEPAASVLNLRQPYSDSFYESLRQAQDILRQSFYSEIHTEYPMVSAIGHTHIDIAWLWTVEQTREKVLRSFSSVLRLMEQYPEYKFMSSQPILYQFVKEQEPEMYQQILSRIKEGRWEVDGAMWLEADCNLTGGESLVRQIIKGHRFIKEEFGKESKSLWLPDVFGYSAALPQILAKSGIPYFMTTKIAWNQYNQLPNDTFLWRGIDGSEVFTFMPTACDYDKNQGLNISFTDTRNTTTYTGIINSNMALGTYKRFQNRDLTEDTLMLFGFGDGGGGPTKEMLEKARRLNYGIPGIPRIHQEFEQDFFDRTYEKIAHLPEMPTWEGELYFEYHRGTLTSMAKNKWNNRKNEILYQQLETALSMVGNTYPYPHQILERGWEVLLLNQFHDIVPGTCIGAVYDQTDKEYAEIYSAGNKELKQVAQEIAARLFTEKKSVVVINTQGYTRDDLVTVELGEEVHAVRDGEGTVIPIQRTQEGKSVFYATGIPSLGVKSYYLDTEKQEQVEYDARVWDGVFENQFYKVAFNERMEIVSLFEKQTEKEFIRLGEKGNTLLAYEDRPMQWDNWDIDIFYQKKSYGADSYSPVKIIENGPVRTVLGYACKFGASTVWQQVLLYHNVPRIDFQTKADWKEHHLLLRVNFPVQINAPRATYEIQFGNVERETTNNTSWDSAKFEVCGHKWADLSENNSGISLLNDCKYGYSIKNGNMSLTLIKAGIYPNEEADIGMHEFTYSIYPHPGRWQDAQTIKMAYNLNVPLLTVIQEKPIEYDNQSSVSLLSCDKENCFVEVIKRAEDGKGLIVRMYENTNSQVRAVITMRNEIKQVFSCNLLEVNEEQLESKKDKFEAVFQPYEIKTFRIIMEE